jgi:hypothetical protein
LAELGISSTEIWRLGLYREFLIVRVGDEAYDKDLQDTHVKIFEISGKPVRGRVMVSPAGYLDETELNQWLR